MQFSIIEQSLQYTVVSVLRLMWSILIQLNWPANAMVMYCSAPKNPFAAAIISFLNSHYNIRYILQVREEKSAICRHPLN